MDNQFVNCSKCGTRNFSDDIICGVCKEKLHDQSITNTKEKKPISFISRWGTPLIGLLIISIIYIAIVVYLSTQRDNQNNLTSSLTTTSQLNQIDTSVFSIPEKPDISNIGYSIVDAQYKNPVRCVLSVRLDKKIISISFGFSCK